MAFVDKMDGPAIPVIVGEREGFSLQSHSREAGPVPSNVRLIGLDVHKETIVIAVADGRQEAVVLKQIPNDPARVLEELHKLGPPSQLRVCYEAGPLGPGLQRLLTRHQIDGVIVAPSLIPVRSGERIKTDRRDVGKLARFLRPHPPRQNDAWFDETTGRLCSHTNDPY